MTGTKPQLPELPHRLLLDERQHLELTGIREVLRFDETRVALRSTRGVVLTYRCQKDRLLPHT